MDITNTMCKLSELSQWEIDSLVDNAPLGQFDFKCAESYIGVTRDGSWGTWGGIYNPKIISYTEMMQLLGKAMEFTKSDLKTGMFVKYRRGGYRMVLGNILTGDCWLGLNELRDDLSEDNTGMGTLDVMSVYITDSNNSITEYLKGRSLKKIWERTEQTPAQKEMEELLLNIEKGEKAMSVMKEHFKLLQSKL
jgi:hypothetical protein